MRRTVGLYSARAGTSRPLCGSAGAEGQVGAIGRKFEGVPGCYLLTLGT